ncbi:MAG: hypothetical protein N3F65_01845 [Nitrososphaeria archaeon]|nr:hypothetical protein [Aigarchaeota archaeon]MCX8187336.1 hypothetical protein [Nitrososphaeria archaeon]MDW8021130.1 hypothetical protein [Nitrososphaerota archaeon]
MRKKSFEIDDEVSWVLSSIILVLITILFYIFPFLEETFLIYVFLIPTIISIGYSIYLKVWRR